MKPLSLRYALAGIFLLGVLYIGGMGSYLAFSSLFSSQTALREAEELATRFEGLGARVTSLHAATAQFADALGSEGTPATPTLVQQWISPGDGPTIRALVAQLEAAGTVDPVLVRAGELESAVEALLAEALGQFQDGLFAEARETLSRAEGVAGELSSVLVEAEVTGLRLLLERQQETVASGRQLRTLTVLWAVVGILLVGAALAWFSARVDGPLKEVEKGLTRVGAGTFDQPVPVVRGDELGRLAEILNLAMTSLRERTDAQARVTRTLQERLGRLMEDSAREIYIFHGHDFHLVQMNETLRQKLGWEDEELSVHSPFDFLSQADEDELRRGLSRLRTGEISVLHFAVHHIRKDGTRYPVEGHIQLSEDEEPPVMLAVARDMTEIYDREDRLRQATKMQAVGQLTGGVAHDFNNLLTIISASLDLMDDSLPPDDPQLGLLRDAMAAAERGGALTHQLLAFSRKQALRPQTVDLNQLLADMDRLLRRTIGEDVQIEFVQGAGLWACQADPTEVKNVVLTFCLNARDAMPRGGKLTVETANARLDEAYAASNPEVRPGQYVMVAVSDTGIGMSPDVLSRAFEPFFTTKEVGEGSGLGLSMAYGFAKQSGGHLKLYSEEGNGTTVRFYLPRLLAEQMDLGMEDRASGRARPGGAGEKILVVEDDLAVLEIAIQALDSLGYRTESAGHAEDALSILKDQPPGTFSLLFTDVVLPRGKSGRDLAREARAYDPGLPVLYTSGYSQNAIIHNGRLDPGVHLLEKPYRIEHLARKVREMLR